jgi:hypothetical protein
MGTNQCVPWNRNQSLTSGFNTRKLLFTRAFTLGLFHELKSDTKASTRLRLKKVQKRKEISYQSIVFLVILSE